MTLRARNSIQPVPRMLVLLFFAISAISLPLGARSDVQFEARRALAKKIFDRMDTKTEPCDDLHQFVCGKTPVSPNGWSIESELDGQYDNSDWPGAASQPSYSDNSLYDQTFLDHTNSVNISDLAKIYNSSCHHKISLTSSKSRLAELPREIVIYLEEAEQQNWIDIQARLANYPKKILSRNVFFNFTTRSKSNKSMVRIGLLNYSTPLELRQLVQSEDRFAQLSRLSKELTSLVDECKTNVELDGSDGKLMTLVELEKQTGNFDWRRLISGYFGLSEGDLDPKQLLEVDQLDCVTKMAKFLQISALDSRNGSLIDWAIYKTAIDNIGPFEGAKHCHDETRMYFAPVYLPELAAKIEGQRQGILDMSLAIKQAYRKLIERSRWPSSPMKARAIEKLELMRFNIGYNDRLLDKTLVASRYRGLVLNSTDYWANNLNTRMMFNKLGWRDQNDFISSFWLFTAHYLPEENSVNLLIRLILATYNPSWPSYANFGQLGSIIAHEITHAFDRIGISLNGTGKQVDGSISDGRVLHENRTECLIGLYDYKTVPGTIRRSNGIRTIDENIADSMVQAAYDAYLQQDPTDREPSLPGFESFNGRKMFWINAAQFWCRKRSDSDNNEYMISDNHSHYKLRANIGLMMHPQFQKDFKCRSDNNTNLKCRLW